MSLCLLLCGMARPRLIAETTYDPLVPLGPEDPVPLHVEAFLRILGAKKPSATRWRPIAATSSAWPCGSRR